MKKIAFFPGSFDPFTKGHEDIVLRGLTLFDEVIIGIGHNANKARYFTIEKMINWIEETFDGKAVKVVSYNDLTANVAKDMGAEFLIRGLRNTTDFEYENSIAQINRELYTELESVFLITSPKFAWISSSIIREVHKYKGDITEFLPYKL